MAERRRLKESRARSQAIATQYGSFSRSASSEANRLRKVVVSLLAPPAAENTSGVKAALSTSRTSVLNIQKTPRNSGNTLTKSQVV